MAAQVAGSAKQADVPGAGRRSDTRDRLLAAAIELFGTKGFDATSLRDIASAVGIKPPAIYNHFESKEQLLGESVVWMMNDFAESVVGPDDPTLDPEARLEGLMRRHIDYQLSRGSLVKASDLVVDAEAVRHSMTDETAAQVRTDMRRYMETLTDVIAELRSSGRSSFDNPRVAAFAVIGMCDRVHSWFRPGGKMSEDQVADLYYKFVRGALGLG